MIFATSALLPQRVHLLEFERRVREYQDRVFAFASYLTGSRDEAGDVTQEVLIRLWKFGGGIEEGRILPWLLKVTRNASIDHVRSRNTRRALFSRQQDPDECFLPQRLPDDHAESADEARIVEAALGQMPEPYRSIVVLRELQQLKYEEIGAAMDMPLNTVKVYLHRGRRMLRERLTEMLNGEEV